MSLHIIMASLGFPLWLQLGHYINLLFIALLIPTSWGIFPRAWHSLLIYLSFQMPPLSDFHPYDALQQLAYAQDASIVPGRGKEEKWRRSSLWFIR